MFPAEAAGAYRRRLKRTDRYWSRLQRQPGVTAQFNLNLLQRINRELGARLRSGSMRTAQSTNSNAGRIECISLVNRPVRAFQRNKFHFRRGEKIITEYSYKYTPDEFATFAAKAGFNFVRMWTDEARLLAFSTL